MMSISTHSKTDFQKLQSGLQICNHELSEDELQFDYCFTSKKTKQLRRRLYHLEYLIDVYSRCVFEDQDYDLKCDLFTQLETVFKRIKFLKHRHTLSDVHIPFGFRMYFLTKGLWNPDMSFGSFRFILFVSRKG